jgi:hypothetical protein
MTQYRNGTGSSKVDLGKSQRPSEVVSYAQIATNRNPPTFINEIRQMPGPFGPGIFCVNKITT